MNKEALHKLAAESLNEGLRLDDWDKIGCVNHDCDKCKAQQEQWDAAIPDAFNEWWNADYDDTGNPYRKDSPAYWAWSGWKAASKQPAREPLTEWIDPNDKTQKQYLPGIGAPVLFCHSGKTYYGRHTGGSFQYGAGATSRHFDTWECRWMPLPAAHGITK